MTERNSKMAYYKPNESHKQMIARVNLKNRLDHETVTANVKLALEKRKVAGEIVPDFG